MKKILKERYWTIAFLSFLVLFDVFFFPMCGNLTKAHVFHGWLVNLFAVFALSSIALFFKGKTEKRYLLIVFLISLFPNLVVLSYILIARVHMHNDLFWVIFASNSSESKEYVSQFIPWSLLLITLSYLVVCIFLLCKTRSTQALPVKKHKPLLISSIVLLILIVSLQYLSTFFAAIDFYKSGVRYLWELHEMKREADSRKHVKMDVKSSLQEDKKHTFVVVIGESLSRAHLQIYDYYRPTTPGLDSIKNELDIFDNVVAPSTHTIAVLKSVLTFADHNHPEYYTQKSSVIELFKSAGFETFWISNQEVISKWGASYGIIAQEADHLYDLSLFQKPDGIVLSPFEEILETDHSKNKVIFIHLMGSHHTYNCRYPDDYKYFDSEKHTIPAKSYRTDKAKKTIDEYDNTVLYTDHVLSSLIRELKKDDSSSFLLFFSDHGEEVYDYRDFSGHAIAIASRYQCEVPFFMWRSEEYKSEMTDIVIDQSRPYSTEHFIHSLSSLAGFEYQDFIPQFSLFSSQFTPQPRMVGEKSYEEIVAETIPEE